MGAPAWKPVVLPGGARGAGGARDHTPHGHGGGGHKGGGPDRPRHLWIISDDEEAAAAFHRSEQRAFATRLVKLGLVLLALGVLCSFLSILMATYPAFAAVATGGAVALGAGLVITVIGERLRFRNADPPGAPRARKS